LSNDFMGNRCEELENLAMVMEAEIGGYKALIAELAGLVHRYRTQTPLGHQPHMICEDADAALAKVKAVGK
jgi:hypothetical protein